MTRSVVVSSHLLIEIVCFHQSNPDNDVLTTHNRGVVASIGQAVLVQHQIVVHPPAAWRVDRSGNYNYLVPALIPE